MISFSNEIKDLADALSKAQGELKDADFDKLNPHFKSKYASLASCLKEVRPVFSKYGLSIMQVPSSEGEKHYLNTIVMHSSGQFISDKLELLLSKKDMQGIGAAMTYARRQALSAMTGISSDEDDDGESIKAAPKAQDQTKPQNHAPASGSGVLSEAQIKRLWAMAKALGFNQEQTRAYVLTQTKKDSLSKLTKEEYDHLTIGMQAEIDMQKERAKQ